MARWAVVFLLLGLALCAVLVARGRLRSDARVDPRVRIELLPRVLGEEGDCLPSSSVALLRQQRLHASPAASVSPRCAVLAGWSAKAHKCLVVFPCAVPQGYRATTPGAWAAARYYETTQKGILFFSVSSQRGTAVLMLDRRWCQVLDAHEGLELACGQGAGT